jgi:hypothetical protein
MKSFFKIIIISVFLLGIFNLNAQENDSLTNKTINPEELKIDSIIAFGKTLLGGNHTGIGLNQDGNWTVVDIFLIYFQNLVIPCPTLHQRFQVL